MEVMIWHMSTEKKRERKLTNLLKKKIKFWKYAVCAIKSKILLNEGCKEVFKVMKGKAYRLPHPVNHKS